MSQKINGAAHSFTVLLLGLSLLLTGCKPIVAIISPSDNGHFQELEFITFSCLAVDPNITPLPDRAIVWTSNIDGEIAAEFSFTKSNLSAGEHTITVTATNEDGKASSASVKITIANRPPSVLIFEPSGSKKFEIGETIVFNAKAYDFKDGTLAGPPLIWNSNIDGEIGAGNSCARDNLSEGLHTITVTAHDSDNAKAQAQIKITVVTPVVTTTTPAAETSTSTAAEENSTSTTTAVYSSAPTTIAGDSSTSTSTASSESTTSSSSTSTSSTTSSVTPTTSSSTTTTIIANWIETDVGEGYSINSLWGRPDTDDVYAVGQSGAILHYNGSQWAAVTSNTTSHLNKIWGDNSLGLIVAVGSNSNIVLSKDNGKSWQLNNSLTSADLYAFWGAVTEAFTAGTSGEIYYTFNLGENWANQTSETSLTIYDLWGTHTTNVYAVGRNTDDKDKEEIKEPHTLSIGGIILHYDGSSWSPVPYPGSESDKLYSIWGSSESDIFAVGGRYINSQAGLVLHYDGTNWSAMNISAENYFLYGVWGSSPTDVYAVGRDEYQTSIGVIFHYDGSTWTKMGTVGHPLKAVWGKSSTEIFAAGSHSILKYAPP